MMRSSGLLRSTFHRAAFALGVGGLLSTGLLAGCGDDTGTGGSATGGGNTGAGTTDGVCILHNCTEDAHCAGCSDGRNYCLVENGSGRCVACGNGTQGGCPEGQECSSYGQCVPIGLDCATDAMGVPTISCNNSGDCAACDPAHQVCDPNTHACVACTETDTSECQSTDICKDGKCTKACADDCTVDNDCGKCGGAKACNKHKCSECSETYACKSGEHCNLSTGTCEKDCGLQSAPGTCINDADCAGCQGTTKCYKAINADPTDPGTCGPPATGCSDLGNGALTLPAPYNQITNTCSDYAECANVGITYNVGEALRDLIGADDIAGQPIGDANIEYPMDVCASVTLQNTSCGVCVPCRVDDDCQDISLDNLTGDLFPGVGGIVIAFLFDQLFGPQDHKLYMYCESVAAGYGVCVPCPGLVNDCATSGGSVGSGSCSHDENTVGDALDPSCNDCAAIVCANDAFCCDGTNGAWDDICVGEGMQQCGASNCHDVCTDGPAMIPSCGACESDVCAQDPYCCDTAWDSTCVSEVGTICGTPCP